MSFFLKKNRYYDEIKEPMDFGTMNLKLEKRQYFTMEEFARDMLLVFDNCRQFNPPGTDPVALAEILEKAFRKDWGKVMERKLDPSEKRTLQGSLTKLRADDMWVNVFRTGPFKHNLLTRPSSFFFREAVDPIKLGIPQYFDIIPRKDARDLKLIKDNLDADKYDSLEAVEADIDLMVQNAVKFNGAASEVGMAAISLRSKFHDMLRSQYRKRKEKDRDSSVVSGVSNKKTRIS
jgi:transcription initiation factor TFIID subunit 2